MEQLKFKKEEKKEIKKALDVILDDLEELWKLAQTEELDTYFYPSQLSERSIHITINKKGIKIGTYAEKITLEKFGLVNIRPKIKDYTTIYYFLKNYEEIRKKLETDISYTCGNIDKGISEIIELRKKYEKEATIELDLPDTINQHTIEIKEENGNAVGQIRLGNGLIRIVTKGSISVVNHNADIKVQKTKRI